ncbi:MAG: PilZ domain-containing protein [Fimbriimonadales bacterium]|nr:PilZ domain-containing protein [Fimbriimonadales bacterium]
METAVQIEIPNTERVFQGTLSGVDRTPVRFLVRLETGEHPLRANMLAHATLLIGGLPRRMTVQVELVEAQVVALKPVSPAIPCERRGRKRYPVNLPAQVWVDGQDEILQARVVNISVSGIGMHLPQPLEVGETCRIELSLIGVDQPLQLGAQVRHARAISDTAWYIGAAFVDLNRADELWLRKLFP